MVSEIALSEATICYLLDGATINSRLRAVDPDLRKVHSGTGRPLSGQHLAIGGVIPHQEPA